MFNGFITKLIFVNKIDVNKNKTIVLIINLLFLNFTELLISLKSC
jgi:hypothetical protein